MTATPSAVVYGYVEHHDSFALYEAGQARELAAEWRAIHACTSLDEFLALLPSLTHNFAGFEPEDFEYMTDPFDPGDLPGAADGDWPPMPTANALTLFDPEGPIIAALKADAGASVEDTTLNGWYLRIPTDREPDLVTVLAQHGIAGRRDDSFIALALVPHH